jgi:hypothetical protein
MALTRQEVAKALNLVDLDKSITNDGGWRYSTNHQIVGKDGKVVVGKTLKVTLGPYVTEAELLTAITEHWHAYMVAAKAKLAPGQAGAVAYQSIDWRIKGAEWLLAGKPGPAFVPPSNNTTDKIPDIPTPFGPVTPPKKG